MNESSAVFKTRSDIRFRVIDREAMVLRQDTAEAVVLNEVGTRILELMDGKTSMTAVARQLLKEFEVDAEVLTADLQEFVGNLAGIGILEPLAGQHAP